MKHKSQMKRGPVSSVPLTETEDASRAEAELDDLSPRRPRIISGADRGRRAPVADL